jgi:predicted ATPase
VAPVVTDTIGALGGQASVVERLAGSDALLVMDNCEHVVDDVAGVVVEVLEAATSTRLLATSQRPLGVAGGEGQGDHCCQVSGLWPRKPKAGVVRGQGGLLGSGS